jgi:hypothetical protein
MKQPIIKSINIMMNYLDIDSYIVPLYLINADELPVKYDGRNTKEFNLHRSGFVTYRAKGGNLGPNGSFVHDIELRLLSPTEKFLEAAFGGLVELVKTKVMTATEESSISNIHKLILEFNGINFISISELDLNKFEYGQCGYGF